MDVRIGHLKWYEYYGTTVFLSFEKFQCIFQNQSGWHFFEVASYVEKVLFSNMSSKSCNFKRVFNVYYSLYETYYFFGLLSAAVLYVLNLFDLRKKKKNEQILQRIHKCFEHFNVPYIRIIFLLSVRTLWYFCVSILSDLLRTVRNKL